MKVEVDPRLGNWDWDWGMETKTNDDLDSWKGIKRENTVHFDIRFILFSAEGIYFVNSHLLLLTSSTWMLYLSLDPWNFKENFDKWRFVRRAVHFDLKTKYTIQNGMFQFKLNCKLGTFSPRCPFPYSLFLHLRNVTSISRNICFNNIDPNEIPWATTICASDGSVLSLGEVFHSRKRDTIIL